MFASLAKREGASFGILQCHANEHILRQRITDRLAHQRDASDADLLVLDQQLASAQPLATEERQYVVTVPDLATVAKSLQSIPDTKPDP